MAEETRPLIGKRIGVFGKGGAGKSTLVVILARALARRGYDVCVLDADSTNVGLHQTLGIDRLPVPLMDYFGGAIFSGGAVTCPVDDPTLLPGAEVTLDRLPDQYYRRRPDGIRFLVAGKIGSQGLGAGCDGPVAKVARDLRITEAGEHLTTLVDFKAGFEDTARGSITSLDWVVVVIDPTQAALQMASDMKAMVRQLKAGGLPATRHLADPNLVDLANRLFRDAALKDALFVLNKVEDGDTEGYMRKELSGHEIEPVGVIHRYRSITGAWLKGTPIEGQEIDREADKIAGALEEAERTYSMPARA
jgi:CO dehydrogenase maturation factor